MSTKLKFVAWSYVAVCGAGFLFGLILLFGVMRDPDNRAIQYIGPFFAMITFFYLLPGLVGGIGLLNGRNWGRIVLIVLSALLLLGIPIGTVLGGIALWILLGAEANRYFSSALAPVREENVVFSGRPVSSLTPQQAGIILCLIIVGSGFVVVLGTGSRLSGQPVPPFDDLRLYAAGIAAFLGSSFIGIRWWWDLKPGGRSDLSWGNIWTRALTRRKATQQHQAWQEEQRQLVARLASHPATSPYAERMKRGESFTEEQVFYDIDRNKLATCVHLQPIERAIRNSGIHVKLMWGQYVNADTRIDPEALKRRFDLTKGVNYAEPEFSDRGETPTPTALIGCQHCPSTIWAKHAVESTPATPIFPMPEPRPGAR